MCAPAIGWGDGTGDPGDEPDEDENPEFDRFEELTKKLLGVDQPEAEDE